MLDILPGVLGVEDYKCGTYSEGELIYHRSHRVKTVYVTLSSLQYKEKYNPIFFWRRRENSWERVRENKKEFRTGENPTRTLWVGGITSVRTLFRVHLLEPSPRRLRTVVGVLTRVFTYEVSEVGTDYRLDVGVLTETRSW